MKLLGKVALVTGAGGGIGRALVIGLAEEGADIVINDVASQAGLNDLSNRVEQVGRKSLTIRADISKANDVNDMVRTALSTFGKIDILVNCAGIMQKTLVADMTEEIWDRTIAVNLKGTFLCCKAVMASMMERKEGRIVNIASDRGISGSMRAAHYAASKGGVIAFTKSLAMELSPYEINVNAIAPGATDTTLWRQGWSKEQIEEKLRNQNPLERISRPEDLVGTLIYLVTDASKSMTGQVIFMKTP